MSCATQVSMSELGSRLKRHQRTEETEVPVTRNNVAGSIDVSLGKARRKLFEVDHEESDRILKRELTEIIEKQNKKYNFDFEKGIPLTGKYSWTEAPASLIPKAYRETICVQGTSGSTVSASHASPSSSVTEVNIPSTSLKSRADYAKKTLPANSKVKRNLSLVIADEESGVSNISKQVSQNCLNNAVPSADADSTHVRDTPQIALPRVLQKSQPTIPEFMKASKRRMVSTDDGEESEHLPAKNSSKKLKK